MTELSKHYDPAEVETRVYQRWLAAKAFAAHPDERDNRYVIMMPLPNVTGALHMGHAMDNVMQDLLIRWHRMLGDNTLWMPGTDHAGIATQAIVEKFLKEKEGLDRHDVGRDQLIERIWSWKDEKEEQIVDQLRRMGCSCDWDRSRFTLDSVCTAAVHEAFFRLFKDGLIYRGVRLVNWDVALGTPVSDDELYPKEVEGSFWHLKYPILDPKPGEPELVTVATTRPETMLGDTAVACHPNPKGALARRIEKARKKLDKVRIKLEKAGEHEAQAREEQEKAALKERTEVEAEIERLEARVRDHLPQLVQFAEMARDGRQVLLPLMDRPIPLITDVWAKPELGSGCVKITPAHDYNDYDVWQRHRDQIGIINILNQNGTLNAETGAYQGQSIEEGRRRVLEDLEERGLLGAREDRTMEVPHSDRSKTAVEPFLSLQWFVRMRDLEGGVELGRESGQPITASGLAQAGLDAIDPGWSSLSGRRLEFHPDPKSYGTIYTNWLSEKRDWCISRQLWWGHRIPIWHGPLDVERFPDLLAVLPDPDDGEHWLWVADPDGEQMSPEEGLAAAEAGAENLEVQVGLRAEVAQKRYRPIVEDFGLQQDPDVLDTWFSSALWPYSTLGWPNPAILGEAEGDGPTPLSYYYPGSCLVTGQDIITLWVARMVITGLYNLGDVPFTDCFVHASILDGKGQRMSKSKGNGIDPVQIIDQYGADAMRYLIAHMQTGAHFVKLPVQARCPSYEPSTHEQKLIELATAEHGKTAQGEENTFTYVCPDCGLEFDASGTQADMPQAPIISDRFERGRNFCTKLWNAARFALRNLEGVSLRAIETDELAPEDRWILSRLSRTVAGVRQHLEEYNPSAALNAARDFFWDELCSWYLEMIKARVRREEPSAAALQVMTTVLDTSLRLLHPFIPFVTEEIWQKLGSVAPVRGVGAPLPAAELLVSASWPEADTAWCDDDLEADFELLRDVVAGIRSLRRQHGLPGRKKLEAALRAPAGKGERLARLEPLLSSRAALSAVEIGPEIEQPALSVTQVVAGLEIYLSGFMDPEAEKARMGRQLAELLKRATATEKRLENQEFVTKAPAHVVQAQRDVLTELRAEIDLVHGRIDGLGD